MFCERTKHLFCMIVSQLIANYIWKLISRFMFQVKMDQRMELEDLSYGVIKTEVLESDEQLFTGEWVSEGSQIWIRLQIRLQIRILPSTSKKIIKKQCSGTESCSFLQNLQDAKKKNCLPNSGGTFISVYKDNKLLRTVEIKIFLHIFPF